MFSCANVILSVLVARTGGFCVLLSSMALLEEAVVTKVCCVDVTDAFVPHPSRDINLDDTLMRRLCGIPPHRGHCIDETPRSHRTEVLAPKITSHRKYRQQSAILQHFDRAAGTASLLPVTPAQLA